MSRALVELLRERYADKVLFVHSHFGDDTVVLDRSVLRDACRFLHDDERTQMLVMMDLTAVDYLGRERHYPYETRPVPMAGLRQNGTLRARGDGDLGQRFEVVYHLYSPTLHHRIRLKVPLHDVDDGWPEVDSVVEIWAGANWYERECWDLYGIRFVGHPKLERMFMDESFDGHALRKDYPKERRQPLYRRRPETQET